MLRRYVAFFIVFAAPFSAFAASLYFSPSVQTVSVGQTFTVDVDASSPDQAMNAASGDVTFPTAKLRVLSVSNSYSAMSLWVQNPTFSNNPGAPDVDFAGIVLSPGYTGTNANVIRIRFQALATGNATLSFSSGAILANDGNGTNILDSMGTGNIKIVPAPPASSSTGELPLSIASGTEETSGTPAGFATTTAPAGATGAVASTSPRGVPQSGGFFITWGLLILLGLLWLVAIVALVDYMVTSRRGNKELMLDIDRERQELHDDVVRIEKELQVDSISAGVPVPPAVKEKQDLMRKEAEHLEDDMKKKL